MPKREKRPHVLLSPADWHACAARCLRKIVARKGWRELTEYESDTLVTATVTNMLHLYRAAPRRPVVDRLYCYRVAYRCLRYWRYLRAQEAQAVNGWAMGAEPELTDDEDSANDWNANEGSRKSSWADLTEQCAVAEWEDSPEQETPTERLNRLAQRWSELAENYLAQRCHG